MKSIDIIMFAFFCSVSIIFIILIVYNYSSIRKSKFLKSETRLINPPPPEKSIDDMSVKELYESYEFHRNKTIELGKAVKKLESAVESLRKNKSYEI